MIIFSTLCLCLALCCYLCLSIVVSTCYENIIFFLLYKHMCLCNHYRHVLSLPLPHQLKSIYARLCIVQYRCTYSIINQQLHQYSLEHHKSIGFTVSWFHSHYQECIQGSLNSPVVLCNLLQFSQPFFARIERDSQGFMHSNSLIYTPEVSWTHCSCWCWRWMPFHMPLCPSESDWQPQYQ